MRRSTCLFSLSLAAGWFSGFFNLVDAEMNWIYKELRKEKVGKEKKEQTGDRKQIPQYFRFNQHLSLTVDFNEHLSPDLYEDLKKQQQLLSTRYQDPYFGHIFEEVQSEYLVASDDGDYVNMVCRTWIDLSREHVLAKNEDPTWQTDFSQIKSKERNDIVPLLPISDSLAH